MANGSNTLSKQQALLWLTLKHFKRTEAWGNPDEMDILTLCLIDQFRATLPQGCWIKVHCGYKAGGHTRNSYHYKGKAIDFHVVGMDVLEAEIYLMKFLKCKLTINGLSLQLLDYVGLGIYPDWANPGFHLDTRGHRASWARVNRTRNGVPVKEKGKLVQQYVGYDLGIERIKSNLTKGVLS